MFDKYSFLCIWNNQVQAGGESPGTQTLLLADSFGNIT